MRMKALTLTVALGTLAATALFAQQPIASPGAEPSGETEVLTYDKRGSLMAVPVTVTGQGPYAFLVDSGAERTVISKELAAQLALVRGKDVRVHSMTEERVFSTALIPLLQFSRRQVTDIHAPALPGANLGAAGILGVDSLRRQRVDFDFAKQTMSITPSRERQVETSPNAIVVTARSLYGRLVITDAEIDGQRVMAIIDTGSDISVGSPVLQQRLQKRGRLGPMVRVEATSITGRRFPVDYTRVGRLRVGNLIVTSMPLGFADTHIFRQLKVEDRPVVMLGMDTLSLFAKVSVDFARKEVRFELPSRSGSGRVAKAGARKTLALATAE